MRDYLHTERNVTQVNFDRIVHQDEMLRGPGFDDLTVAPSSGDGAASSERQDPLDAM